MKVNKKELEFLALLEMKSLYLTVKIACHQSGFEYPQKSKNEMVLAEKAILNGDYCLAIKHARRANKVFWGSYRRFISTGRVSSTGVN